MQRTNILPVGRLSSAIDALCDQYVTHGPLSHIHCFLSVDGQVLIDRWSGFACADGTPVQADSLYRLASMSKPVTIAAVLSLVEEGQLSLDMPVADIVPEFSNLSVWTGDVDGDGTLATRPCERAMTLLDLLRHSAGFSYSIHRANALDRLYGERSLDSFHQRRTADEYAAALAEVPLLLDPAMRFHYSLAIDVLAVVLERVTGQRAQDFIESRILRSLGMEDSHFVVPPEKLDRLTDAWMIEKPGNEPIVYDRGAHSRWRMTPKLVSTGGGLVSSTYDYHRFLSMMMNGGELDGARVLSADSVALMMRNHLICGGDLEQERAAPSSETEQPGIGMGLGAAVLMDPARASFPGAVGTYYWGGILSTGFFIDPARRMIGLVMTQLMPSGATALREDFRHIIYSAFEEVAHG